MPYYIDMPDAQTILRPRVRVFAASLVRAMREWNGGFGQYHARLDEHARAVNINKLWYSFAEPALSSDTGVLLGKVSNGKFFVIDDKVVLRFKQADSSYRTRNYPTARALAWEQQAHFPSIPPLVRLDLGYRLDLTGTVVTDAVIMLKSSGHMLWHWQFWGHPISEFAAAPKDMLGRLVYAHDDYSGITP